MKRGLSILVSCLIAISLCYGQDTEPPAQEASANGQFVLSFAPGAGFEVDFSRACTNISVPVELRLLPVGGSFNFAIGERITMHRGHKDADPVFDQRYYSWLEEPYLTYDQISTYLTARWNIIPYGGENKVGLFAGAAYLFNLNTNGKVYLDAPRQGPWPPYPTQERYDPMDGYGLREYRCEALLNPVSHSVRFELGFTTPGFEVLLYAMLPMTNPVNLTTVSSELYYDRTHANSELSTVPVTVVDGITPYLPITLLQEGSHQALYDDVMGRYTLGFSLKAYIGTGWFRALFHKNSN